MPELPEVETARLQMDKALRGKRIEKVFVDVNDLIVFDRARPNAVKRAIEKAKVIGTQRKGKYFWLKLDCRPWPVFHLGMSGHIELRDKNGEWSRAKRRAKSSTVLESEKTPAVGAKKTSRRAPKKKSSPDRPPYCRLLLTASDGTQVALTDPRRFGRIRLAQDPLNEAPISKLGADPLEEFPSAAQLKKVLATRRAPIKSVLLDQSVFAGVGNWIADEILFQARLSPHRLANALSMSEIKRIHARTLSIIRKAVRLGADYERFPDSWLFHDRWGKRKEKESYNSRGYEIKHDTIGGRTSAWVPALQF